MDEIVIIEPLDEEEITIIEENTELIPPKTQEKTVDPRTVTVEVTPDDDYTGLSKVTINPFEAKVESKTITENGTYKASDEDLDGYSEVTTNIKYKPNWLSFRNCTNTELDYETQNIDTSNVTSFYQMFSQCSSLTSLDLSKWDTSNVTRMESMFYICNKLTTLNVNGFDTSKVKTMRMMFYQCSKLQTLDLSSFDTSKVYDMSYMFSGCSSLTKLDIRNFIFNITAQAYYQYTFSGVPDDCLIIVKSDTEKEWITSKFTTLTNVKTVSEIGE